MQITSALRTRSSRAQGDDHAIRGLLQMLGELLRAQGVANLGPLAGFALSLLSGLNVDDDDLGLVVEDSEATADDDETLSGDDEADDSWQEGWRGELAAPDPIKVEQWWSPTHAESLPA